MLGGNPAQGSSPATSLLYAGEHFDTDAQQYYLRARWYNPLNGRFNRVDPYSGNNQNPQSLHKYLYCHNNPVNGIDPTGLYDSVDVVIGLTFIGMMAAIAVPTLWGMYSNRSYEKDAISKNPELWKRRVNRSGIWAGWIASGSMSFLFVRMNGAEGRIYNPQDMTINTGVHILGGSIGLGMGISAGGGALLVFNAKSLEDITQIGYWDADISFDLLDPVPEGAAIKMLAKVGLKLDDLVKTAKLIRLKQVDKTYKTLEKIQSALDIAEGKPTALLLNPEGGLQLYLGVSYNEVTVTDPSFE